MEPGIAKQILQRYLSQTCTEEEKALVESWYTRLSETGELHWQPEEKEQLASAVQMQLMDKISETETPVRHISFLRKWRWVAAAILILAIGSGVYYFSNQAFKSSAINGETRADIVPGTNRAILTLSNGTQKELTLADNGLQLQSDAVLLTTPNGGQYQAILPDGSKVWLNAASSIKFPSKFNSAERKAEITGEVYFEIAKDKDKPFIVQTKDQQIKVLGTEFNVNAYDDEPYSKTALVQGSIKIGQWLLKPGEAYYRGQVIKTNVQQDIAWKNGLFDFNGLTLEASMRQLERWYDIKIVYEDSKVPNKRLAGKMTRGVSLNGLLEYMESIGLHYQLKGKNLMILP